VHGATRVVREIALWVVAVLGSVSILAAVAAVGFGVTPLIFRSGSMSPGIPTGSLGLAQRTDAADVEVGDIVSAVWSDGTRVTHRVVGVQDQGNGLVQLETKGDANEQPDTEHPIVDRVDRVFWSVPEAGYVLQEITKPYWVFGSGVIVGAIVVLALIRPRRPEEDAVEPAEPEVRAVVAADWPPRGRVERVAEAGTTPRHAGARTHARRGGTAGLLAGAVLVVSVALLPAPVGTLAAFNDSAAGRSTFVTGTVPNVASVGCSITGVLAKSVVLTWPAATGGLGPITSYRVSGPGVDQVVNGLTLTIPPGLLTIGTLTFTVQSRYGTTPWLSTGVSRQVNVVTSLLVGCV
jgi:signal peptidase I